MRRVTHGADAAVEVDRSGVEQDAENEVCREHDEEDPAELGRQDPVLGPDADVLRKKRTTVSLFLGPGFRLAARWNRLGEAVKTHKKRENTGKKWARYGLKRVNKERKGGITWEGDVFHVHRG